MSKFSRPMCGLLLVVCAGCASQGLRLPFSGPRITPADSAAVAAVEQRVQRVEAGQAELTQLVRGMNATLAASLSEINSRLQEVSERQSSQERWIAALAREGRNVSSSGSMPSSAPTLPPIVPGSVRLDSDSQSPTPGVIQRPVEGPAQYPPAGRPAGAASRTSESADSSASGAGWPANGGRLPDPPEEGLRLYETAYRELHSDNYQIALINFREFLDRYPRTSLSDNAQYWIGEAYYAQGQYESAIEEFRKVIDEHPGEDKEPAAYYKIALSFKGLRDSATARRYFDFLIQRFPQTHEAQLARDQLANL